MRCCELDSTTINTGKSCGDGGFCLKNKSGQTLPVGGGCNFNDKVGTYKQGLCSGGSEIRCCVPNK